jgi:RNA polymerase sigma-70 factor (ECF subfamily)
MTTADGRTRAPSDHELLEAALADPAGTTGRRAASDLLGRYQRPIYVWCLRYVEDHDRAVEMAQDVLMRAYRRLDSFRGRSKLSSWLYIIARNTCLNELERPALLRDEGVEPDRLRSSARDPEQQLLDGMAEEELLTLIREKLDPREQRALWLRCFERMPVDAITQVLAVDDRSGARSVLQSARRKLRAALEAREG